MIQRTERLVAVDRRKIHVTEAGEGAAVVLLHGGGPGATGAANFSRNIDVLAERFRVVVPDMPGYGRSTKGIDGSDPFGDLAGFVAGLVDALDLGPAHLVGNSYGGAAALRCALETPSKVAKLVLMGPGGIGTTRGLPTRGLNLLLDYYKGEGPTREKVETFIRDYLVHDGTTVPDELIDLRFRASIDPEVVADPPLRRPSGAGAPRTLLRMDLLRDRRLAAMDKPTLVLWGADDRVNRPSGATQLAGRLPVVDSYVAARTGHWFQWERADLFNSLVSEFLERAS